MAAFRPKVPIAGISSVGPVLGGLSLVWGVQPVRIAESPNADPLRLAVAAARSANIVRDGDLVAVVFGSAGPRAGSTDSVRIVRV